MCTSSTARPAPKGPGMSVAVGWSKNPNAKVNWAGGPVSGIIVPDRRSRIRLVAATAPPGLEPIEPPSLDSHPHTTVLRAQWFGFAAIALIIYGLAVRKRLKEAQSRERRAAQSAQRADGRGGPVAGADRSCSGFTPASGRARSRRRSAASRHLVEHMVFKGAGGARHA